MNAFVEVVTWKDTRAPGPFEHSGAPGRCLTQA